MTKLFDETRNYVLGDPELDLIGDATSSHSGGTRGSGRPTTDLAARSSTGART